MRQDREQWHQHVNEARRRWTVERAQKKLELIQDAMKLDRNVAADTVTLTSSAIAVHDREKKKALARLQDDENTTVRVRLRWRCVEHSHVRASYHGVLHKPCPQSLTRQVCVRFGDARARGVGACA
jgi:hypothetical protein